MNDQRLQAPHVPLAHSDQVDGWTVRAPERGTVSEMCSMARILIIDDDAQLRATLREVLELEGYEVVEAHNGREGLERYQEAPPEVMIMDILMPEQDGLETIMTLRRVDPQVKIIAISGGGQTGRTDFLHLATMLGVQRTLRKPFRPQELIEAVRDLLQGQNEGKALQSC